MTWTYSSTNLTTDLAKIRLAIGDTVDRTADNQSLTDEEIAVALAETSSLDLAAVRAMEDWIARFTQVVSRSAAGVTSAQGDKLRAMMEHLKILKKRAGKGRMTVYAGGISKDRIEDTADDTDYERASFSVGQDDKP